MAEANIRFFFATMNNHLLMNMYMLRNKVMDNPEKITKFNESMEFLKKRKIDVTILQHFLKHCIKISENPSIIKFLRFSANSD